MIVRNVLRRWFEEQLTFSLSDGSEAETVFIGTAEFSPVDILKESDTNYEQEFSNWLFGDWKSRQYELRETLLDYSANADRYSDLRESFNRQQVLPFVGSGMSVDSGLPTWADFLVRVGAFTGCDISRLKQLIRDSQFEEAADLLAHSTNPRLFAERVEHDLRIGNLDVISGAVCLLPGLFTNLMITTNLDNVLEQVYQMCDMPFAHVLGGSQMSNYRRLKSPGERFLLKLHGDCRRRDGRVLLSTEYEDAYGPDSIVREELTLLYKTQSLLFLGCSLGSDRTVQLIREIANADANMPKHYAFLAKPDDSAARIDRENFLTDRGIFPIWYDLPHEDAIMALLDGLSMDEIT